MASENNSGVPALLERILNILRGALEQFAVKYYTDRTGVLIVADTQDIPSDCHVITFINHGTALVTIKTAGGKIKRVLNTDEEVSFGTDRFDLMERGTFEVEFAAVGAKELGIERATYKPV